jgi:hypothetical protein
VNIIRRHNGNQFKDNPFYNDWARRQLAAMRDCAESLLKEYEIIDYTRLIEWLADNRIELNSILSVVGPEVFSGWLKWKILQVWPRRDCRRAVFIEEDNIISPTMKKFNEFYAKQRELIIKDHLKRADEELSDVEAFIENTDEKQEEIENDIINNTLLTNDQTKKIDLGLERIMNGDGAD